MIVKLGQFGRHYQVVYCRAGAMVVALADTGLIGRRGMTGGGDAGLRCCCVCCCCCDGG